MYIEYSKNNRHYKFTFEYPLNLIIGDSSTGKTDFVQQVIKNRKIVSTDASRIYINPIGIDYTTVVPNSIVLIDSDDVLLEDIKQISSIKRNDITFVIFGRKYAHNFPFAIMNTFQIVKENGVQVNKVLYNPNEYRINNFNKVVVEDSKSGYLFFKSIFHNVHTSNGNGDIMKHINHKNLLILDSIGFGGYIEEFCKKARNTNVSYILYNSFESFILEEKFGYYDIPVCINIEDGFTRKLQEYIPMYSKKNGCTGRACSTCKLDCKTSSKELLEGTKYSNIINHEDRDFAMSAISKMRG